MLIAYIGLGSNLSGFLKSPQRQLEEAIKHISGHPGIVVKNVSSFYETKPIGPQNQPDFVNAVANIETSLAPLMLLDYLQKIEANHDRERIQKWGARTLDLDILLFDNQQINSKRLTIPHPEIENRAFVLAPLLEIYPNFKPLSGKTARTLLEKCKEQGIVKLKS